MLTQIINARILTPQGWLKDGSVLICDGKILEVTNSDLAVIGATVIDAKGMTVEVIADGIHLPATILKLVYKLKGVENTCLVTDALAYATYEGKEPIDRHYIIENGVCKLADHSSLAGSLATMDLLVRIMVKKAGIPLEDAVRMASETPARLIGVDDRKGGLSQGKDADVVILDKELNIRCVWSMGKIVSGTDTLLHK